MGILDNIPADPSPLSVVIDFNLYVDGAKLSTLARKYFTEKAAEMGAASMEEYFAKLLLIKLKETLIKETNDSLSAARVSGFAAVEELRATVLQQLDAAATEAEAIAAAALSLELQRLNEG
jgi:hypothetical protein